MAAMAAMAATKMAGAAVNAYGQYLEGKAKYEALNEQSSLNLLRASEIHQRLDINVESIRRDTKRFQGEQIVAAASSGTDAFSGANLSALDDTADAVAHELANLKRDTFFQTWMLEKEAFGFRKEARDVKKATNIRMAGTILSAAGGSASAFS